jgi:hypothetical protein
LLTIAGKTVASVALTSAALRDRCVIAISALVQMGFSLP